MLNDDQRKLIANARKILVIQAENPDGDSLGSALALEEILSNCHPGGGELIHENLFLMNQEPKEAKPTFSSRSHENNLEIPKQVRNDKTIELYCPVQIPTYLRYVDGWSRVSADFPTDADLAIIVDTSSKILLSKTLEDLSAKNWLETHDVLVFDHHVSVTPDLPFDAQYILSKTAVATGELIFDLAQEENWTISPVAAKNLFISIQSDSLGLTTQATTAQSFLTCGELVKLGAIPSEIDNQRREFAKKSAEILQYKGELIERIEYYNGGRTALIFVPFNEIQKYSNEYNPTMLVLDEMRMVKGVDVTVGVKTYPDGKLTGKLRTNIPVSDQIAGFFGGGGHPYAAGFRTYEKYNEWLPEFLTMMEKIYREYDAENGNLSSSGLSRGSSNQQLDYPNKSGNDKKDVLENNTTSNFKSFRIKKERSNE